MQKRLNSNMLSRTLSTQVRVNDPRNNTKAYSITTKSIHRASSKYFRLSRTLFSSSALQTIVTIGLFFHLIQKSAASTPIPARTNVTTTYSGALSWTSPKFVRPTGDINSYYYYHAIQVMVFTAGLYSFESSSSIDTYGCFYNVIVDSVYSYERLIACNDDSDSGGQFRISLDLQPRKKYILAVTTYDPTVTGNFWIIATGPALVDLHSTTLSTVGLIRTTTTTSPAITSTYSGTLSSNSLTFSRPPNNDGYYYYQAFQMTPSTTGRYMFASNSSMDTYGYLYNHSFDPFYPSRNLIAYNDDGNGNSQFRINVTQQAALKYILIVTTHGTKRTGNFSIKVVGPAFFYLTLINEMRTYPNALSGSRGRFSPLNGTTGCYYYQATTVETYTAGTYLIIDNSSMNTYGYLYNNSFDSLRPSQNLITYNYDDNGDGQFRIMYNLQYSQTYILVVATYINAYRGSFLITVVGPGWVYFNSMTTTTDDQSCGGCGTSGTDCKNHKSNTGKIVGITVGCIILCVIICCVLVCRHKCKKTPMQQPILLTHNQTVGTQGFPVANVHRNTTIANGIYGPYTIPMSRWHATLEEPPPSYESVMSSFRTQQ